MADQLAIWNVALAHLGQRRLATLADPNESARVLADEWIATVNGCLEVAPWQFATRLAAVQSGGGQAYGFVSSFQKPADWVRTTDLAPDAAISIPLDRYVEEGQVWLADPATLFVRYVSNDAAYGLNVGRWHQAFADWVALALAARICRRLTGSDEILGEVIKLRDMARDAAMSHEDRVAARTFQTTDPALRTRLRVYNLALSHLGQARVAALTETSQAVRSLHDRWPDAVAACLRAGPWAFALRAATIPAEVGSVSGDAYANVVPKPTDWLMTVELALDAAFQVPLLAYADEAVSWLTDAPALSVRYVSADPQYGGNAANWTPEFADFVAVRLAEDACGMLGASLDALKALVPLRTEAEALALQAEAARSQRVLPAPDDASRITLQIYNAALGYLGRPRIASLLQVGETTRALNEAWLEAVLWALSQGPWTWSIRAVMIGPQSNLIPTFGYRNAFEKPADWLQTVLVSEFEDFGAGATRYADETGWWFSDAPGLFARYVSSGPSYGMALSRWPATFRDLVASRLAEQTAGPLGAQKLLPMLTAMRERAMKILRASDALNTPPKFAPQGSWVAARRGQSRAGRRWGDGPGGPNTPFTGDSTLTGDSDLPVNTDIVPRISG